MAQAARRLQRELEGKDITLENQLDKQKTDTKFAEELEEKVKNLEEEHKREI